MLCVEVTQCGVLCCSDPVSCIEVTQCAALCSVVTQCSMLCSDAVRYIVCGVVT